MPCGARWRLEDDVRVLAGSHTKQIFAELAERPGQQQETS
jgi:hypothetical protein